MAAQQNKSTQSTKTNTETKDNRSFSNGSGSTPNLCVIV